MFIFNNFLGDFDRMVILRNTDLGRQESDTSLYQVPGLRGVGLLY